MTRVSPRIHDNCFIIRDSNGYKCLTHNTWVHRYALSSGHASKIKDFYNHYYKIKTVLECLSYV